MKVAGWGIVGMGVGRACCSWRKRLVPIDPDVVPRTYYYYIF